MKAVWGMMLTALFVPSLMAQTADQALYQQAKAAVRANDPARFMQIRANLTQYPLLPYLDYYQLNARLDTANYNDVAGFISQHSDIPQSNRLERSYMAYLAKSQQWSALLRFYPSLPRSTDLRCLHYQANYYTGNQHAALQGAGELWLSGQSLPEACTPLFELWQAAGLRTQDKIWQRMVLAFEAKNLSLIRHLSADLGQDLQPYGEQMQALFSSPANAINPAYFSRTPYSKQLLLLGLTRYANQAPEAVLGQLAMLRARFELTDGEVKPITQAIARRLMQDRASASRSWLDSTVKQQADSTLTELRARVAIWEQDWAGLSGWIALMPAAQQQEDRWQYWRARALEMQGQSMLARDLYLHTATFRGFYGFLAAQHSGLPYPMKSQSTPPVPDWQSASRRWPFLLRVSELLSMNEISAARAEWIHNLDRNSLAQRIEFGYIALNQGWHDLAVLASIRAKAWDALDLRFPLPLAFTFSQIAQERAMNTSLLYAISRQESALYPHAQSPVGARGMMQLMPATAKETADKLGMPYGSPQQLFDPELNVRLGSAYLKRLLNIYDGNRVLAAAAYNAGPGRIKRWRDQSDDKPMDVWVESIPYNETRNYVQNVLSFDLIYQYKLRQPLRFMSEQELNHGY
ncbi:MAG: transglycosylase SLT domain-containing protein [Aeromonas sp.]